MLPFPGFKGCIGFNKWNFLNLSDYITCSDVIIFEISMIIYQKSNSDSTWLFYVPVVIPTIL